MARRSGETRPNALRSRSRPALEPSPTAEGAPTLERWIWAFVAFGIVLRLVRYLTDRPLWGDEAMVAVNVLHRSYGALTGPLSFFQVAPLLFLWTERAAVDLLGASTWALRLGPAVCAVVSVPLFGWVACRTIGRSGALLAVATFAVSYAPIRHAAEVKPYAADLLASLALLSLAVAWLRRPERSGPLWALSAITPVAMAMSNPAVFVSSGIALALSPEVWRRAREPDGPGRRLWMAWGVSLAIVPASFAVLYALSLGPQSEAVREIYRLGYWSDAFPPLGDPVGLIGWLIASHTGEGFAYPIGGERGASVITSALCLVAILSLWRRGHRRLLALLLAPIGLTLVASMLGRYPYGGSARTMQHLAPMICLLVGLGAAVLIERPRIRAVFTYLSRVREKGTGSESARCLSLSLFPGGPLRSSESRSKALANRSALAALGLIGLAILSRDLTHPYRTVEDLRSRDFARWFWPEQTRGAEVCCVKAALGSTFEGDYWRLGRWELYLSHRDLLLPPGVDPARPRLDRVTADRPLRCVVFNDGPETNPRLASWLSSMRRRYELRGDRSYTVNGGIFDHGMPREERYRVFEFVPRP